MKSPFTHVAKVALDEIVHKHLETSKFGYFISEDGIHDLVGELLEFLATSRSLKSAGDRFLIQNNSAGEANELPRKSRTTSLR